MASTYEPIATTTLGSGSGTITFNSIPSTYTDLRIILNGKATGSSTMRINGDTGTNYSATSMSGNGSTAGSYAIANSAQGISLGSFASAEDNNQYILDINIMNYSNITTYKNVLARLSNPTLHVEFTAGLWRSTSAINSITMYSYVGAGTYATGTVVTLYGIKAA